MSKKVNTQKGKVDLDEARRTLSRFDSRLPPDVPYEVVVRLLNNLDINFRSTKEGLLIDSCLHINLQHRNGGNFTIHRKGFSQALRYARARVAEM